ncbi:tRNA dimethylallyltransferase [Bombyx mandarina]|uniref:tRNA dimethylallyltransferase n=1 Tax=Bombyx mandarina TaxID=7092 RepID=A0A6J2JM14_BOMMA|nr:tRNA dimethylallyltransferase [Bombyx mandarina]
MALRTVISSRIPMVIILGATGTGKTKLGVELAQKFATEIISADSMQIYKGLDIVTAKASPQEREMAPHHLLDILEPHQFFTVVDFRNRALKIIDSLIDQKKIPIIVGGTIYYIESIVYQILVESMDDTDALLWDKSRRKRDLDNTPNTAEKISKKTNDGCGGDDKMKVKGEHPKEDEEFIRITLSTDNEVKILDAEEETLKRQLQEDVDNEARFTNTEISEKLRLIDPAMANRLHPNNRRKILRSIEVWLKTGRRHSEILDEQKVCEGQLRKPDSTIILWLKCEQDVHDKRLDARVDSMLDAGLIEELLDFHERHNRQRIQDGSSPDYTKGVFQTLGFKEFHDYLMMSEDERNSEAGKKLLKTSIENMKMATRRYARRQNKMFRQRFLEHPRREVPLVYELDTTDVTKWDENVKNKAIKIIESFINSTDSDVLPIKQHLQSDKLHTDGNSFNFCEICNRIIIGDNVYAIHLKSVRHMKVLKKMRSQNKEQKQD